MPDEPQHAVRDGDYRVIYVVGKKGLYKFFPDSAHIAMMKPVDVDAGEQGYMVGYGALTTFPPAGGIRILIPTRNNTSPGGLWILTFGADGGGSTWVLKNGAAGANPLPAGWDWHNVAASPKNGNTICMYGTSSGASVHPTASWPDGFMQDASNNKSPLWMTNDGGDNWFELPLPAPIINQMDGAHIDYNQVWLTYNDGNTPLLFAQVIGTGNFFGVPEPSAVMWWGNPVDLQVRAAFFDGTDTPPDSSEFPVPGDGDYYFGTGIDNAFLSMTHGVNGEMIASGNFGTHTSDDPPYPGLRVIWIENPPPPAPYPAAHWNTRGLQLASLDRTTNPSTGIVGISDGDIYYTDDYHVAEPTIAITKEAPELGYSAVVATGGGVVAKRTDGLYHINDIGSGSAPVLGIAINPSNLTSSRQAARQVVAGRMSYNGGTGDDVLQANFAIYDGNSWTTVLGPTDAQGRNQYLSSTALAVTEG